MKILPVYTYDHPILRKKLKPIEEMTDGLIQLALDMHTTMNNADGIGLAANQVGRDVQMLVINISGAEGNEHVKPITMINPVIEAYSEEEVPYEEGCLSLPDLRADVVRPEAIEVRYFDTAMKEHQTEVDGLLARVMQHEIDHLRGIYFFDHLAPMRRALMKRKLLEIKRGEVEADYPLHRA
ncbi:MAG: peptide deformylase [Ignavibacteriae bacterium]|nr:peptide deformylase [Ignavibacteriota bacterium]MCB9215826.1 peptide deformylase [Ignavibacteria bacterium]